METVFKCFQYRQTNQTEKPFNTYSFGFEGKRKKNENRKRVIYSSLACSVLTLGFCLHCLHCVNRIGWKKEFCSLKIPILQCTSTKVQGMQNVGTKIFSFFFFFSSLTLRIHVNDDEYLNLIHIYVKQITLHEVLICLWIFMLLLNFTIFSLLSLPFRSSSR